MWGGPFCKKDLPTPLPKNFYTPPAPLRQEAGAPAEFRVP